MPGLFDDLIPQQAQAPAPQPPSAGLFDDLLPQKEAAPTATPGAITGSAPVAPSWRPWPIRLAEGAIKSAISGFTLPHDVMTGDASDTDTGRVLDLAQMVTPMSAGGTPMKVAPFKAPTEAALEASKNARYADPAIADLRLKPEGINAFVNVIKKRMLQEKLDPQNAPGVTGVLDRLQSGARFEEPTTQTQTILSGPGYHIADDIPKPAAFQVSDLDLARQSLSNVPYQEKRAAAIVRGAIDKYLGNIPTSHVLSGDAAAANDALLKARADAAALKRSQDVSSALGRAENQAGSTYSGQGFENASRQQLRPILNEKMGVSKRPGFEDYTPEELEAARQAVNGTWLGNLVRSQEKRLAGGHGAGGSVLGMGAAVTGSHFGLDPISSAALGMGTMAAGKGLGMLASRMAAGRGNYLGDLLRSRSALADEMRANPQMVPAFWPQLLRIPGALGGAPPMPAIGFNAQQL